MQALISKMIETARSMTVVPPRDVILATQATKLGSMDPEAYGALAHSLAEFGSVLDRLSEVTCPSTGLVGELVPRTVGGHVGCDSRQQACRHRRRRSLSAERPARGLVGRGRAAPRLGR